jgi:MerR family transcriptional regulator/heat shock protein HspR
MYVISIAAELAGVHPQTLMVYERKGLVSPQRTEGNTRRYTEKDIEQLRKIQELTHEGINLAGVVRILDLEVELGRMHKSVQSAMEELDRMRAEMQELMATRDRSSIVPLRDVKRIRRAMKADFIDSAGKPRRIVAPPITEVNE